MYDSLELLGRPPDQCQAREEGKNPGNMIWLWGQGYAPSLPNFLPDLRQSRRRHHRRGRVRGLGRATGLRIIDVPGATGYIDTDYVAKANYALTALDTLDFVYVHVESPGRVGARGEPRSQDAGIEDIDKKLLGTLREGMAGRDEYRLVIVPDHKTPISLRTHEAGPVPFLLYDSAKPHTASHFPFDERAVTEAKTFVEDGTRLIQMLFA